VHQREAIAEFLAQRSIVVVGVSSNPDDFSRAIFERLKTAGYRVFAVNPKVEAIGDEPCYPNIGAIPADDIDGAVVLTSPAVTEEVVRECAEAGIRRVWMHRSFGPGSHSKEAAAFCRANDITVIPNGCPMMFCEPVDIGHKCMGWWIVPQQPSLAKRAGVVLLHALVGWAACGAIMGVGPTVTSMETTLLLHLIGAPVIFGLLSWNYARRYAFTSPLVTAVLFTGFVVVVDFLLVATLILGSYEMFASPIGTWIPFTLIFASTYLTCRWFAVGKTPTR
jgi:predicted CoA-binding protein